MKGGSWRQRELRLWSRWQRLCVLALALVLAGPYGAGAQEMSPSSSDNWKLLKQTLQEALVESESLEKRLTELQSDNERLLSLSNQQGESLLELSQAHDDLATSLERLSQSLRSSNEQARSLGQRYRRSRLAWQIGIPAGLIVGLLGGVWVAN